MSAPLLYRRLVMEADDASGRFSQSAPTNSDRQARLDQRLANQLKVEAELRQRGSLPAPTGHPCPCPPYLGHLADCPNRSALPPTTAEATSPPCSGQLDLAGNVVESSPLPTPVTPAPVARGQQLALPVTVSRAYTSTAWGGTVTEPPLPKGD